MEHMRFCLVSSPGVVELDPNRPDPELFLEVIEGAPLGILSLAAVLEEQGQASELVDLNELHLSYLRSGVGDQGVDLYRFVLEELLQREFDVIGFSSICSSYPLTLRLAEGIRRRRPGARIILGGPQASAVDAATLEHFPAVDVVVRGEAEQTLPELLEAFELNRDPGQVPGLTFRRRGEIVRNPPAQLLKDLDRLPLPAYHLHPFVKRAETRFLGLSLELGRGCPYACTFCSTNDFFRRQFRLKSPPVVIEQMSRLEAEYGVRYFDLIHDMFTVDRKKVVAFCEAMIASGKDFRWHCSARTDRVDEELLALMAEAGCRGVFYGIETGSAALQKKIKKRLDLDQARAHIRASSKAGLGPTVSLITGFPEETESDFRDTVDFFMDALRLEDAVPQLHILAPLADTPLHRRFKGRLILDDAFSDISRQGFGQDPADRRLIADFEDIFPNFYGVPTPLSRSRLMEIRGFLLAGAAHFRWLLVALHREPGEILEVFQQFQEWRIRSSEEGDRSEAGPGHYRTAEFRATFAAFVRERYSQPETAAVFSALLKLAKITEDAQDLRPGRETQREDLAEPIRPKSVPRLAQDVRTVTIGVDYPSLMQHLTDGRDLELVPRARRQVVSRKPPGKRFEVSQLSGLLATLLDLCDGTRTVEEISERLATSPAEAELDAKTRDCRLGLHILRDQGFVEIY